MIKLKFSEKPDEIIDLYPDEEKVETFTGKGLVFQDMHHGTAYFLKGANGNYIFEHTTF